MFAARQIPTPGAVGATGGDVGAGDGWGAGAGAGDGAGAGRTVRLLRFNRRLVRLSSEATTGRRARSTTDRLLALTRSFRGEGGWAAPAEPAAMSARTSPAATPNRTIRRGRVAHDCGAVK